MVVMHYYAGVGVIKGVMQPVIACQRKRCPRAAYRMKGPEQKQPLLLQLKTEITMLESHHPKNVKSPDYNCCDRL